MRIVQVSAHFPPNFVSGGTLVPQRIARGLSTRGHEVLIYAGHLGGAHAAGTAWEEDVDGYRVRWIATTPWTAWTDSRNYDNPVVADDFGRWLDEVCPDVVHLHSLQTLGGSLVPVAKASGAAVVVTMHDFWWFDARQFLVDASMRPTPVVTSCAAVRASDTNPATRGREQRLAGHLAAADLVLTPSRLAAEIAAANGVDPARLGVDENGVDVDVAPRTARGKSVRLAYAGGSDSMKGAEVVRDALERLPSDGSWTADLYGMTGGQASNLPDDVRFHEAFDPRELPQVLAAHDVLLLPSIMRESHSILTREAMRAGLAVITSDCVGPEAVVEDGRTGLVVPTGDAEALVGAVRRLIADPDLLDKLQKASAQVPVRSVGEQLDGLETTYGTLVRGAGAARTEPRWRPDTVLFVVGIQGAPLRYRAQVPAEALELQGVRTDVRHYRDPELRDLVASVDAVVLYRVPATWQVLDLIRSIRAREEPVPVVCDIDDLIFDPSLRGELGNLSGLSEEEHELWWRGVARYRTTLEQADMFVGTTATLCEQASRITGLPSRRFRNGVGLHLARVSDAAALRPRRPGRSRIGYFSGTTTHDADWAAIEPAVIDVMRRHDVELVLGGHVRPTPALAAFGDKVRRVPMLPWYRLPAVLRDVDVCLAPLADSSDFNDAKSAIKWLEAALVETPTVATPTAPFREAIEHGRTGMLAGTTAEWVAALEHLLDDDVARRFMGSRARRRALLSLSPHLQGRRYLDVLADAREVRIAGVRRSEAEPVADHEPWSAADAWVEPYVVPTSPASPLARLKASRAGGLIVAARRTYRADGLTGVARRARGRLSRMVGS